MNVGHVFYRRVNFFEMLVGHNRPGSDQLANKYVVEGNDKRIYPEVHFFFLIKHQNAGKIDSHLWLFKGFANYLNP